MSVCVLSSTIAIPSIHPIQPPSAGTHLAHVLFGSEHQLVKHQLPYKLLCSAMQASTNKPYSSTAPTSRMYSFVVSTSS